MNRLRFAVLSLFTTLVACTPAVAPPGASVEVLNTSPIHVGSVVVLDGSGSTVGAGNDGLGLSLDYHWRVLVAPPGSAAQLSQAQGEVASLAPDHYGAYRVGLIVDNGLLTSPEATASFEVEPCGATAPVVESIGLSGPAPVVGAWVQLEASISDADNLEPCSLGEQHSWSWGLVQRPEGSLATLNDAASRDPSFLADRPGAYAVQLIVTDSTGLASETGELAIDVSVCGDAAPSVASVEVSPEVPGVGQLVRLGAELADSDNEPPCGLEQELTAEWALVQVPTGSAADLSGELEAEPWFLADVAGDYVIRTTALDDTGRSSWLDTTVTVSSCGGAAPVARIEVLSPVNAGPDTELVAPATTVGLPVHLDAGSSSDPDELAPCLLSQPLEYSWRFVQLPVSSYATFNDPQLINPTFVPDEPGIYELELEVWDGAHSSVATLLIEAEPDDIFFAAAGVTVEYIAGGALFDNPEGITSLPDGSILVVQNGGDRVTRSLGGVTSLFSSGGLLRELHDLVWDPARTSAFATTGRGDGLIRLSSSGGQEDWAASGDLSAARGVAWFVDASGAPVVGVGDRNDDRVIFFDPTDSAPAQEQGSESFGGNADRMWGVEMAVVGGVDYYWATIPDQGELWRTQGWTDRRLTQSLDEPHDVVRGPSGALYVADSGAGQIVRVEDCAGGNCSTEVVVAGSWEPWGLSFDAAGRLLVTDRAGDALYRLSGSF